MDDKFIPDTHVVLFFFLHNFKVKPLTEINCSCSSSPGDVCVDITAQIKTKLKAWTWELARVAEGMEEWEVIFKVCPHSCPRWEEKQMCYPVRDFVNYIDLFHTQSSRFQTVTEGQCVTQM